MRNPIDAFVLERLEKAGLKPAPEADRTTLIRRVSLDFRGFSPSLPEVDGFLNDTNPDAYEKMVDRMLASPHFGEKMAAIWLDLARFGDTSGFHYDSTRQMWLWRDWVIDAYNRNLPFDQFTIEQLAGDLLPNPSQEQKIASGFNRNTRFNEEGGADPEEFVVRYTVDRTSTLGSVWMGLTLSCAECHSHKYDSISQKEFYQLYAFFTGIKEPMASGNHGQPLPPLLKVVTPEQTRAVAELAKEKDAIERRIQSELAKVKYEDPAAGKPEAFKLSEKAEDVAWIEDDPPAGAQLAGDGPQPWQWGTKPEFQVFSGQRSTKRSGPGLHQHYFTGATQTLTIRAGDKLFAHVWLDPKSPPKSVQLQFNDGTWEHRAYWGEPLTHGAGRPDGPSFRKMGPLPKVGEWVRLEVDPKQVGLAPGAKLNGWAFTQFDGTVYWDKAGIRTKFPQDNRYLVSQSIWEQQAKNDGKLLPEVRGPLQVEPKKRQAAQLEAIRHHYLRHVYKETRALFDPLQRQLDEITKKTKALEDAMPHTLISEEMEKPRPAHILIRGDFLQKGEKVEREVPAVFPAFSKELPRNRLGLAKWLFHPDQPLTARVAVNRLWQQMFAQGLVRSLGDFGSQGDYPSHPELLDWLAAEFSNPTISPGLARGAVGAGKTPQVPEGVNSTPGKPGANEVRPWDVKRLLKLIATSATYRQSSAFGAGVPKADPHNRLLSRAPRFRLQAEEVRDNALAIADMLHRKIGGPSMMPYQPPDFYKGKNEGWPWKASSGAEQYRRGLYTFWRRTSLHPMMALFDAPSREECSVSRSRTNTPLQALVTLNDPTFVEAARVFGQRILTLGPKDVDGKIVFAFRTAVARAPSQPEANVLRSRYQALLARYQADPAAAQKLVRVGSYPQPQNVDAAEHAAWTGVASILLNLDETITRE